MFLILALSALVLCEGSVILTKECTLPPNQWCSSEEAARQCQVLDLCQEITAAKPVAITLYYESLCPGCRAFVNGQLWSTYKTLGKDVINITLVPYGNAHQTLDETTGLWQFTCQHGQPECLGNIIETCAVVMYGDVDQHFPFTHCMESSDDPINAAESCATKNGLSWERIHRCAKSSHGNKLEHMMGQKTESLKPPHQYTPWIVVNGQHTEPLQNQAMEDLTKLVCSLYKGPTPSACKVV